VSAALLLLDFASTSVVSASTAASYLAGEVSLPFPSFVGPILVLVIFTIVSLTGIKESARIALVVLMLHVSGHFVVSQSAMCGGEGKCTGRDNGGIDICICDSLGENR